VTIDWAHSERGLTGIRYARTMSFGKELVCLQRKHEPLMKTISYLLILVNITSFGIRGMYNSGGKKPDEYNSRRFKAHAGLCVLNHRHENIWTVDALL
jgi:hypothetical protein